MLAAFRKGIVGGVKVHVDRVQVRFLLAVVFLPPATGTCVLTTFGVCVTSDFI